MTATLSTQPGRDEMYGMKPLHQDSNVELPSCMYRMKNLHSAENGSTDPDMKSLVEKDKKIASDLVLLMEEVKELSRRLGHNFGDPSPIPLGKTSLTFSGQAKSPLPANLPEGIIDLVISVSISQPAFSSVLIGEYLKSQGIHVATLTQKHSSLKETVPANFLAVTGGLGGRLQHDVEKLVMTFVWKDDEFCPSLMQSPRLQTRIVGDTNIGRYLCRVLCPQLYDEDDLELVAEIDRWLETSVQLSSGNSKEKDAALKAMNSHLGMNNFFCKETLTLADVSLLASLLANSSHIKTLPKNVKKWFLHMTGCFKSAILSFNVPSVWTSQ